MQSLAEGWKDAPMTPAGAIIKREDKVIDESEAQEKW